MIDQEISTLLKQVRCDNMYKSPRQKSTNKIVNKKIVNLLSTYRMRSSNLD